MTVISIPIYLKPREKKVPNVYEVKVGGYVFHRFTYQPILLWEHMDDIRSGKLYPLAPLLVLLTKNPTEETLAEERDIIKKHEPDPDRRRTLFTTAILTALAQNIFDSDFLWNFFKEPNMLLADDPFLNRLFNERYGPNNAKLRSKPKRKPKPKRKWLDVKLRLKLKLKPKRKWLDVKLRLKLKPKLKRESNG